MAVKLLLIKEVEDLGLIGDIVSVKPGYARNFLLPQGFGVIADKNAIRKQVKLLEDRRKKEALEKKDSEELATQLEKLTITTKAKVDQVDHMYGSVSILDIIHLLKEQHNIEIHKRCVLLKHPIKHIGETTVPLKLVGDVDATLLIKIDAEKEGVTAEKEEIEEDAEPEINKVVETPESVEK